MKILKEGMLPTEQDRCIVCGCEFEFDRTDVLEEYLKYIYVKCPTCGDIIYLTKEQREELNLE